MKALKCARNTVRWTGVLAAERARGDAHRRLTILIYASQTHDSRARRLRVHHVPRMLSLCVIRRRTLIRRRPCLCRALERGEQRRGVGMVPKIARIDAKHRRGGQLFIIAKHARIERQIHCRAQRTYVSQMLMITVYHIDARRRGPQRRPRVASEIIICKWRHHFSFTEPSSGFGAHTLDG